jgi:hypothetical protein
MSRWPGSWPQYPQARETGMPFNGQPILI